MILSAFVKCRWILHIINAK